MGQITIEYAPFDRDFQTSWLDISGLKTYPSWPKMSQNATARTRQWGPFLPTLCMQIAYDYFRTFRKCLPLICMSWAPQAKRSSLTRGVGASPPRNMIEDGTLCSQVCICSLWCVWDIIFGGKGFRAFWDSRLKIVPSGALWQKYWPPPLKGGRKSFLFILSGQIIAGHKNGCPGRKVARKTAQVARSLLTHLEPQKRPCQI